MKKILVVLDFDGLLLDSYGLLKTTFARFDFDVGDEQRFRNRRKFLKYFGGGKEILGNLAMMALPKKRDIREALTEEYYAHGLVYAPFVSFMNTCIDDPGVHIGILSRNYTLRPGPTIRHVLRRSGVNETALDFVIPLSVGSKKDAVLEGMLAPRYRARLFAGDEIADYKAACASGYTALIGCYGFDHRDRLRGRGDVPEPQLFDSPEDLARRLWWLTRPFLAAVAPASRAAMLAAVPLADGAGTSTPAVLSDTV